MIARWIGRSFGLAIITAAAHGAVAAAPAGNPGVIHVLVPGFTVEELPVRLSNQNNLRFAPDGSLTSLGYDGRIWRIRDTDGDGLEDRAEPFWDQPTLSVPLGMAWSADGLYVSSKGKVSRLRDTDRDGRADTEEIIASGWPATDVGSGGVDATAVTLDADGNVYFGLLVADYSNAYRLRKRADLKPAEIDWLKEHGRWREASGPDAAADEFTLYDLESRRGTIQRFDVRTRKLETLATGIRVPVALAFNRAGDLFNTDQEGETWMPNGNPLDELNHIVAGRNYGFPPPHPRWLSDTTLTPPVVGFAPQHQSACGLVFNEPRSASGIGLRSAAFGTTGPPPRPASPGQELFGPAAWKGDAFVAGESRGKIFRVHLEKGPDGYVGRSVTFARLSMLTLDVAISPRGHLYVCCHSGGPDWGAGPQGPGRIFRIRYSDAFAPQPVAARATSSTEVRLTFDRPVDPSVVRHVSADGDASGAVIEFGEYVSAGDRFEVLKPSYAVVSQQDATPRGHLAVHGMRLADRGKTLVLTTDPHVLPVRYALTLPGVRSTHPNSASATVDLEYDLSGLNPALANLPSIRASSGTDSRPSARPDGDWEHGRELFAAEKLNCVKCHRLHGEGGTAGPDLSNIQHRDTASVLRDIREPSATLHPDYVTFQAERKDGEIVTGFVRKTGETTVMADVDGREISIPRDQLVSLKPGALSLMPAGLLDGLKESDVRDLLTHLQWEHPVRSREEVAPALTKRTGANPPATGSPLRLVLVASKQDHGPGQHDYPRWQEKWMRLLAGSAVHAAPEKAWEWPTPEQFAQAQVIVFYFWNHDWSAARLAELDAFQKRGGGIVLLHAAIIADRAPELLAQRFGLAAQPGRTGYRHMPFELSLKHPGHPLARGLPERATFLDEPYWPLIGNPGDVEVIATGRVDGEDRPLVWTHQQGEGRVFACIPGHYAWTLDDPLFRVLVLRGIAWAAGADIDQLTPLATAEAELR